MREEYLRQTLATTPHAPPEYRANGPVSNRAGFYEAFNVAPGDRLYRDAPGESRSGEHATLATGSARATSIATTRGR